MTTSAVPTTNATTRLTYARARLWLGISGVGTAVMVASAVLAFDVSARLLPASATQSPRDALASLLLPLLSVVLLFLPFDVIGGGIVVRTRPSAAVFVARWARGVLLQLVLWLLAATVLITAARAGGKPAAIAAFVALQILLAQFRAPLARAIAQFTPAEAPARLRAAAERAGLDAARIAVVASPDEGFVGGWSGIVARTLVLPARWLELPDDLLVVALRRRRIIAESGAHRRGVLGAIAWNTLGFALVLALSGADVGTAAGVLTMAAGMTLWAFVGVLLLPTPSRAAVFAVDAAAARETGEPTLSDAIEHLDRWQDDEARRSAGVETIFHPVPSRSARVGWLKAARQVHGARGAPSAWTAHHLARHSLWLGWGTLSLLSRLVHCNVGRPALWAMLPGD